MEVLVCVGVFMIHQCGQAVFIPLHSTSRKGSWFSSSISIANWTFCNRLLTLLPSAYTSIHFVPIPMQVVVWGRKTFNTFTVWYHSHRRITKPMGKKYKCPGPLFPQYGWKFGPETALHNFKNIFQLFHKTYNIDRPVWRKVCTCSIDWSYDWCSWRSFGNIDSAGALSHSFIKKVHFITWIQILTDRVRFVNYLHRRRREPLLY